MALAERPRILLLSLAYRDFLDEVYSTLFNRLAEVANIKRAKTANAQRLHQGIYPYIQDLDSGAFAKTLPHLRLVNQMPPLPEGH
ncbi:hypothetical protein BO71DRAFT_425379 [Aspergillus ellipticus CBS 707.79]|uniref:Uncharacterized protein n=1 Tax=Aspergillus ellipticus CBS 707.79 TaxID=1448320 RepID=A0A319DNT3_9EURO|nr:hypothetical protein BO71DRAFT_425379 [Aspergillus ellipticus CBS 707.79]